VSYADLDLSTPFDASMMLGRLKYAAQQVCGVEPDIRNLAGRGHFASCFHTAMDNAVRELPSPLVRSLYAGLPQEMASK
jgi:UrcA family protein